MISDVSGQGHTSQSIYTLSRGPELPKRGGDTHSRQAIDLFSPQTVHPRMNPSPGNARGAAHSSPGQGAFTCVTRRYSELGKISLRAHPASSPGDPKTCTMICHLYPGGNPFRLRTILYEWTSHVY